MNARATRFPLFDSLRALAALAVLGTHAGVHAGLYGGGSTLGLYAARLEVGVTVFFVISGFLLYRPFVRARLLDEPQPATGAYAWRRFLRIAPPYWVALTAVGLWLSLPGPFSDRFLAYYGFAQTYSRDTFHGGLFQAWTLCIEIAFYAFLPVYAALMRAAPGRAWLGRLRGEMVGLALLVAGSIAYKLIVVSGGDPDAVDGSPALVALPAYLDQFALGMGLAVLSVWLERRQGVPRALAPLDRFPALAWGIALAAFWAVSTQLGFTARFFEPASITQYMERHGLYAVVAVTLVVPAVVGDQSRGLVRRFLGNRVLLYLGLISYGLYLYGGAVELQLDRWGLREALPELGSGVAIFLAWALPGLLGSVLLATLSYYLVERPALSLKRLVGRHDPAPGEAIAEPTTVSAPAARAG